MQPYRGEADRIFHWETAPLLTAVGHAALQARGHSRGTGPGCGRLGHQSGGPGHQQPSGQLSLRSGRPVQHAVPEHAQAGPLGHTAPPPPAAPAVGGGRPAGVRSLWAGCNSMHASPPARVGHPACWWLRACVDMQFQDASIQLDTKTGWITQNSADATCTSAVQCTNLGIDSGPRRLGRRYSYDFQFIVSDACLCATTHLADNAL